MNDRITIDPELQHGKPVIRGTRVPVARILGGLAGGMTFDEICREYDVAVEDIRSAIKYAEDLIEQETHHPLPMDWLPRCGFWSTLTFLVPPSPSWRDSATKP
jgi:uncharacterized protein (DUF433 family)